MFTRIAILVALGLCAAAQPLRINCGGPFIGSIGWREDTGKYRSPAAPLSRGFVGPVDVVAAGNWAPVYKSHAYSFGANDLEYRIPVPAATYSVDLLFAETWGGASEGVRKFSVTVNGKTILPALDVFATGGGVNKAVYIPVSQVDASSGFVTVTLGRLEGMNNPMISGIVVNGPNAAELVGEEGQGGGSPQSIAPSVTALPSLSSSALPSVSSSHVPSASASFVPGVCSPTSVLLNVGGPAVGDYSADSESYIDGLTGSVYTSSNPVTVAAGADTAPLYLTERFTSSSILTYKIPVSEGTYIVTSMHAESYFTAAGKRVFDISINGDKVETGFDIYVAAGNAKDVAVEKSYPGIVPVGGFITISYIKGAANNPVVNAIKLVSTCGGTPTPTVSPSVSAVVDPTITPTVSPTYSVSAAPVCTGTTVLLNAGGTAVGDYIADNVDYIDGPIGVGYTSPNPVKAPTGSDPALYLTERFTRETALTYKIPVSAGTYTVTSMHAESYFTAPGKRVFDIEINGAKVETGFDVFVDAGNAKDVGVEKTYPGIVALDGFITISYIKGAANNPIVNAIKIVPECGTSGPTVTPTVSASESASASEPAAPSVPVITPVPTIPASCETGRGTDSFQMNIGGAGLSGYGADNEAYISGPAGIVSNVAAPVTLVQGADNGDVFKTERYTTAGALTYNIPVPAGTYTVTTFHAESYVTSAAKRLFSILINGKVVKADLDVFSAAGGINTALVQEFSNISPVGGVISISFKKGAIQNPFANGIKITGTGADTIAVGAGCSVPGPSPSAAPSFDPSNPFGCVVIDAADYVGTLADNWTQETDGSLTYKKGDLSTGTATAGTSPLEYTFTVPRTSHYAVTVDMTTRDGVDYNDVFLKFSGGFIFRKEGSVKNGGAGYVKAYHNKNGRATEAYSVDFNPHAISTSSELQPGQTYTIVIGARSSQLTVHRIVMFPCFEDQCNAFSQHWLQTVKKCV